LAMRDDAAVVVRAPLARGFALVCLILLAGACNHELAPPPEIGTGAGGSSASSDGPGGHGGNTSCLTGADVCVQSCAADYPAGAAFGYCNAIGAFDCPAGSVKLSSCPADACAQPSQPCCDETTGRGVALPCGPDGLKQVCVACTRAYDAKLGCIPTGLATADCRDLDGKACGEANQECHFGVTICSCLMTSVDVTLTWHCETILIP